MKRILSLILAVGVLFALSGQAAAFSDNDLTMVVYNEDDLEVGVNLGDLSEIDLTASNVLLAEAGTVSLSQFGSNVEEWGDLSLAYFAPDRPDSWDEWFALTTDTSSGITGSMLNNFLSQAESTYSYWNTSDTDLFVGSSSNSNSYNTNLNGPGTGTYGGINNIDYTYGEANLAALVTDGYVDMYLYHYVYDSIDTGTDTETDYTAVLRLYSDGSVVLNPVPIPASVLLLGSGLIGLLGFRRKRAL